jgi:transketolase
MALADKADARDRRVISIHGDGELQEGSIWEAAMSAAHYKLDNLTAVIDRNGLQIDGKTSDVMEIEPLADKWIAFGWDVYPCDGHNPEDLIDAFKKCTEKNQRPKVIIARTTMGKGVREIEGNYRWHGKAPGREEAERFTRELERG